MSRYRTSLAPHWCGTGRMNDPYVQVLASGDFHKFKSLADSEIEKNWSTDGLRLYYIIAAYKRLDIFNYLINLDNFDIDSVDSSGRTLLMCIALVSEPQTFFPHIYEPYSGLSIDQFALALIRKGANLHLTDDEGNTYLHMAAIKSDHFESAQLVIEKGADVNAQNNNGMTPLYVACHSGNIDYIDMLLYYGVIATIPTNQGVLPIAVLTKHKSLEGYTFLQELLFHHTFDDDDITVPISILIETLYCEEFCSKISKVTYEISDLAILCDAVHRADAKRVEFLLKKFPDMIKDMINNFPVLDILSDYEDTEYEDTEYPHLGNVLKILLESEHISMLVLKANTAGNTISSIVKQFSRSSSFVEEMETTKIICLMLSYGLPVNALDLNTVYHYYGYCELFKILLHMDIIMVPTLIDGQVSVATLYCNPSISFDELLDTCSPVFLSKYYSHPKLKEVLMKNIKKPQMLLVAEDLLSTRSRILRSRYHDHQKEFSLENVHKEIVDRAAKMPQVPLLVELSRNVARKYIADRYSITNSRQFYTVLNWLPVGEMNKNILRLEKVLYP